MVPEDLSSGRSHRRLCESCISGDLIPEQNHGYPKIYIGRRCGGFVDKRASTPDSALEERQSGSILLLGKNGRNGKTDLSDENLQWYRTTGFYAGIHHSDEGR